MTIEHTAACDGCGERRDAHDVGSTDCECWEVPSLWITIMSDALHDFHFCTWRCALAYIAQRQREEQIADDASNS